MDNQSINSAYETAPDDSLYFSFNSTMADKTLEFENMQNFHNAEDDKENFNTVIKKAITLTPMKAIPKSILQEQHKVISASITKLKCLSITEENMTELGISPLSNIPDDEITNNTKNTTIVSEKSEDTEIMVEKIFDAIIRSDSNVNMYAFNDNSKITENNISSINTSITKLTDVQNVVEIKKIQSDIKHIQLSYEKIENLSAILEQSNDEKAEETFADVKVDNSIKETFNSNSDSKNKNASKITFTSENNNKTLEENKQENIQSNSTNGISEKNSNEVTKRRSVIPIRTSILSTNSKVRSASPVKKRISLATAASRLRNTSPVNKNISLPTATSKLHNISPVNKKDSLATATSKLHNTSPVNKRISLATITSKLRNNSSVNKRISLAPSTSKLRNNSSVNKRISLAPSTSKNNHIENVESKEEQSKDVKNSRKSIIPSQIKISDKRKTIYFSTFNKRLSSVKETLRETRRQSLKQSRKSVALTAAMNKPSRIKEVSRKSTAFLSSKLKITNKEKAISNECSKFKIPEINNSNNIQPIILSKEQKNTQIKFPSSNSISCENFICEKCHRTFRLSSSLEAHKKTHIVASISVPVCKFCDKKFAIPKALNNHLLDKCSRIPASERKKLLLETYATQNADKKIFKIPKLQPLKSSVASLRSPDSTSIKRQEEESFTSSENLSVLSSTSKSDKKILEQHSGIYKTPSKLIACHPCKKKFDTVLKFTEHVLGHSSSELDS